MATRTMEPPSAAAGGLGMDNMPIPGPPPPDGDLPLINVTEPYETDVLCGRGGAALRHPGNQTYRKLVSLNKGLYITCLKTEKLKISRSIVAAIREQRGRFLEKDSRNGTWFDIGDKKAIEKTSQALREGQPKLRQKIVEMGGGSAGTQGLMENQYGHSGVQYGAGRADSEGRNSIGGGDSSLEHGSMLSSSAGALASHHFEDELAHAQLQGGVDPSLVAVSHRHSHSRGSGGGGGGHHHYNDIDAAAESAAIRQQEMQAMPPPGLVSHSHRTSLHELHDEMLQRLSLTDLNCGPPDESPRNSRVIRERLVPSLTRRGIAAEELGMPSSSLSIMSEYSAYAQSTTTGMMTNESLATFDSHARQRLANSHNSNTTASDIYHSNTSGSGAGPQEYSDDYFPCPPAPGNFYASNGSGSGSNYRMSSGSSGNYYGKHGLSGSNHDRNYHHNNYHHNNYHHHGNDYLAGNATSSAGINGMTMMSSTGSGSSRGRDLGANAEGLVDRRRVFAKMKYNRPPSAMTLKNSINSSSQALQSNRSMGDGMPDIHMVESQASLYSNLSVMTGLGLDGGTGGSAKPLVETAKVVDHSARLMDMGRSEHSRSGAGSAGGMGNAYPDALASGSRHSIMSGLSRISDTSLDTSIFSDLSKKIGNVSTRSIAMSEISAIDMQERDNEDDDDSSSSSRNSSSRNFQSLRADPRQATMEFGL